MASSSSSSSSSCPPRNAKKMYDVFLSFRGEDTRDNFTSHLHHALYLKSIKTFIDDQLIRGENISHSLLDTIEASSISIIIFSERYASSRWCLDELLKILECKHEYGQIVIPVFYHVDPSHVRSQSQDSSFGKYFSGLEKRYPEKMQRWKNALTEATNLSGFDSHVIRPESKLIEEIANDVLKRLDATFQTKNKGLVGVECPIEEIESLLRLGSEGVYKLGIWGIGGIGKTTIAGAVFNKISRHFEGSYFAHNVRDAEETGGIEHLQKKLLSELLNDGNVRNIESQLHRLACKKVLIVFDDVIHPGQIESLIGFLDRLASGSRVIITTRDKQVLENCWVNQIYRMKELVDADAHKLFCQCAFKGGHLDASYTEVTPKAIKYAHGVPLALKVLGRHLCGRSKEVWESAMRKLEIVPHMDIQKVLKISYDSLDDSQKNVFLDIACYLEGKDRDVVISFFDASGFEAKIELSVLEGKSLITCSDNQIRMHDLLRDMGREIVRNESIDHPGKRSRLWHHNDICEVLKEDTGTEALKGISLDMNKVNREIHMNSNAFSRMPKLRFLRFYGDKNKCMVSHLEGVPFPEVRHLEWPQCPLKTLNICAEKLVSLKMPCSKVKQLWDDVQDLVNLKEIDLSGSESLTKLPDLSRAENLKILRLDDCLSLTETHSSIQYLNKLEFLTLEMCKSLTSLPTGIHSKYLKILNLWGCSNLNNFPEITSCHICIFELAEVGIKELPSSIECLSNLRELLIMDCSELESISSSIFKLKSLKSIVISHCSNFKRFLEIPSCNTDGCTGIERLASFKLKLEGCSSPQSLPINMFSFKSLPSIKIIHCPNIESLPSSLCMFKSLTSLEIVDCQNFKRLPDELGNLKALKRLTVDGTAIREVPESLGQLAILRRLKLTNCSGLESISSSIFKLKSLKFIEISNCSNFKRFLEIPSGNTDGSTRIERLASSKLILEGCSSRQSLPIDMFSFKSLLSIKIVHCPNIESLPSSLCMFKSLKYLEIVDCQNFKRLPDELGNLKVLKRLTIDGTAIREVPKSLSQLAILRWLKLTNCSGLGRISSSIFKLKSLKSIEISNCSNFKRFLKIPSCNIDGGTRIERLPSFKLRLEECSSLQSLPSSLCMVKNLTSLKIIDCQKFKRLPNEIGNSKCLTVLIVKGTAIREVPESLGQLSSLESLVLSNNKLERLPESFNQLSSLEYLQLFENSLEGIPEYLRSLPSKLTSLNLSIDLRYCLKLDSNELSEIVKGGWMKQSFDGNIGIAKSMYFPGNEIPKWFRYQSMGSSVTLKTPPTDFLNNKILVGFAFCIVVAFPASEYFEYQIPRKSRPSVFRKYKVFYDWKHKSQGNLDRRSLGTISYVGSDHVFLGSYLLGSEDLSKRDDEVSFDEVSFYILPFYGEDCEVKQCGIHFVYAQDSTESREEEEEEEEPHTKRLKCSSTPKQLHHH